MSIIQTVSNCITRWDSSTCLLLIRKDTRLFSKNKHFLFSFSQPGSRWWHVIHPRLSCPLNAVWLSCFIAFILALPYLGNTTAYVAITSLSTICLYISYALPILCKLLYPGTFFRGPFHLGKFSILIDIVALLWVCLIVVLFVLPPIYPVTAVTMNYASVGVGSVILISGIVYFFSAKYWFQGPITNLKLNTDKNDIVMRYL